MEKKEIHIINGPNLNLLGRREPDIYGNISFEKYFEQLRKDFPEVELFFFQSNVEGEIINKLHEVGFIDCGIILNAGGYTHTSVAIADAVAAISAKVVEVHISQPLSREKERHVSLISKNCAGSISGFGMKSYQLGIRYFLES